MLSAKAEFVPAKRPSPHLPLSTFWDLSKTPANNFVDLTDVTGNYKPGSNSFVLYDRALESLESMVYLGTGGEPLWAGTTLNGISASGAYIVIQSPPQASLPVDLAAITPVDLGRQLAFTRHYLSLNTTDLSRILLVERPTIYAWLDGRWDPKQENRGRIRKLYQVARNWQQRVKQPIGRLLREPVDGDASLMDYLVRDPLELGAVDRVLVTLGELTEAKGVRSVREVAKQRGFKPVPSALEDERFDQITRF